MHALGGDYCHRTSTRPPNCVTPWQPTINVNRLFRKYHTLSFTFTSFFVFDRKRYQNAETGLDAKKILALNMLCMSVLYLPVWECNCQYYYGNIGPWLKSSAFLTNVKKICSTSIDLKFVKK